MSRILQYKVLSALMLGLLISSTLQAADSKVEQGIAIIGDKELPRVLYIVPWKGPDRQVRVLKPMEMLQNMVVPIDPDVFDRSMAYHKHMKSLAESEQP